MFRSKAGQPVRDAKKQLSVVKAVTSAVAVTDELLAKVNTYALEPLTADDIFIGKQLLAHNGIDRDNERFPEAVLDDFAATLPGKSTLYFHNRNSTLPLGLYFDTKTEAMTAEQFKALTGADIKMPTPETPIKTLWAWWYAIKTDDIESVLKNIKGGTYRHWSISFNAASIVSIKDEPNGPTKYWEYVGPAEALEGSLVWLGAQQGATSQKSAGNDPDHQTDTKEITMKNLLLKLGVILGKSFADDTTEDQAAAAVKTVLADKDTKITELTSQVDGLKADAELGKKYLDNQASEYTRLKAVLGECQEDEDSKKKMTGFAKAMGVDFLQGEIKHLEARVAEKYPGGQLAGNNGENRSADSKTDDNPLVVK